MTERLGAEVDVAVVGGGITGLLAAHHLRRRGGLRVVLFEGSDRVGGKVWTGSVAGIPVERGPDGFLFRGSALPSICVGLQLGADLLSPAVDRIAIWSRGRARPLPTGLPLGLPSRPAALARSGILSLPGAMRAALDLVLPPSPVNESTTVAEALEKRFGREVRERLVDPLVGGVYAGDTSKLGLADALPDLYAAAARGRSLLRSLGGRPGLSGPAVQTLRGGLQQLTDRLAAAVDELRVCTPVTAIREVPGEAFELSCQAERVAARAVILAAPAYAAARLLRTIDEPAAELLARIRYAGVVTVSLAYAGGRLQPTGTSGFLVPPREGRLLTAVTWASEKWGGAGAGRASVVRCSAGRDGDERWRALDDQALVEGVRTDLAQLAGIAAEPLDVQISRWEAALPQYAPGHLDRVTRIEARLAGHPGLFVAGAAYRGIGLTACAAQAERAAAAAASMICARRAE